MRLIHVIHDSLRSFEDLGKTLGTLAGAEALGTTLRCSKSLLEKILGVLLLSGLWCRVCLIQERLCELM